MPADTKEATVINGNEMDYVDIPIPGVEKLPMKELAEVIRPESNGQHAKG